MGRSRTNHIIPSETAGHVYYVRLKTSFGPLYKLGFTSMSSVEERFAFKGNGDDKLIDKVYLFAYDREAFFHEMKLHSHFAAKKAFGHFSHDPRFPLYQNGQSELYYSDVLDLDPTYTDEQGKRTFEAIKAAQGRNTGNTDEMHWISKVIIAVFYIPVKALALFFKAAFAIFRIFSKEEPLKTLQPVGQTYEQRKYDKQINDLLNWVREKRIRPDEKPATATIVRQDEKPAAATIVRQEHLPPQKAVAQSVKPAPNVVNYLQRISEANDQRLKAQPITGGQIPQKLADNPPVQEHKQQHDEDLGRNFVIRNDGFVVTDRNTRDALQVVIRDGMCHAAVLVSATGMNAFLQPWPLHSNPFRNDHNFQGSGNDLTYGAWEFSITPSVPFSEILTLAREQNAVHHVGGRNDSVEEAPRQLTGSDTGGHPNGGVPGSKQLVSTKVDATAGAPRTESAELAYERGDYVTAFDKYSPRAAQGEAQAQYMLALMHHKGRGVTQDFMAAVKWYRLAAEQGHCLAQTNLSAMYYGGDGVERDYAEAARWNWLAAEEGDALAQDNLGMMYEAGNGVSQDCSKAVEWYRLAATAGFANAICNLGRCYENGVGAIQDCTEARRLYRLAAGQGHARAQHNLGTLLYKGLGGKQDYGEAAYWYGQAAEQGQANAQCCLADMYLEGKGVGCNIDEGVRLLRLAAAEGNADAQNRLGLLHSNGQGVSHDVSLAFKWLRLAAAQGSDSAQNNLGVLYYQGVLGQPDRAEAVKWYKQAAEQGHVGACLSLASMYLTGDGIAQDVAEAIRWYSSLSARGNVAALMSLGCIYYGGANGVRVDHIKAASLFRQAAELGDATSQRNLGVMLSRGEGGERDYVEAAKWFRSAIAQGNTDAQLNLNALIARAG